MTELTTISTKGQVTIPSRIREMLQLDAGTKVRFLIDDQGALVMFPIKGRMEDAFGVLPKPKRRLSDIEMDQAISAGVTSRNLDNARD